MKSKITDMNIILLLVLGSFLGIFSNCSKEDTHITIGFNNKTAKNIEINVSYNYPDTSITYESFRGGYIAKPYTRTPLNREWEKEIELYSESGVVMLFLFDSDTMRVYGKEGVIEGYKILKRYDLSLKELDSLNWELTYP